MKVELVAAFLLAILVVLPSTIQSRQDTDEVSDAVDADVRKSSGTEEVETAEKPSFPAQAVDDTSSEVKSESERNGVKISKTGNKVSGDASESKKKVVRSKKESNGAKSPKNWSAKKLSNDLVEQSAAEDEDEEEHLPLTNDEVWLFRNLVASGEFERQFREGDGSTTTNGTAGVGAETGAGATTAPEEMTTGQTTAAGTSVRKSTPLIATSLGAVCLAIMAFRQGLPASKKPFGLGAGPM